MFALGLTGGIGAGKSTVSQLLAERGAVVIDADAITREVQAPGGLAYDGIVERFGPEVLASDGTLDRPKLASIVFNDPKALADLNRITHPVIGRVIGERLAAQTDTDNVVILDIPLLGSRGGRNAYNTSGIIVVNCPTELAVERLVAHRGMDEADARARIANQISREERLAMADFVVDNSGDHAHLAAEVERCWSWISERKSEEGVAASEAAQSPEASESSP